MPCQWPYTTVFKPVLDLVGFERLDVSLSTSLFPLVTTGGTTIPPGLKLDVVNFQWQGRTRSYTATRSSPFQHAAT